MTDDQNSPDPAPKPAPRPGAPSPAVLAGKTGANTSSGSVRKPGPAEKPLVVPAQQVMPASDPSEWGRVDESGTVFVRTADGEREVGSWQAGDVAEGLAHFGRRFDDLVTEVALLETRLETHPEEAGAIRSACVSHLEAVPRAAVVGDLDSLSARLDAIIERTAVVASEEKARRKAAVESAIARKEELAAEAEEIGESSTKWKAAGDRLRAILDEWKTIKGIDRKTDDALWKRYSRARDAFNRRRGSHFAELDRNRATARKTKEELVDKAEALQHETDWNAGATGFRKLMDEWKAAGRAPRDADDALWARFNKAQDTFFAARHAAAAERDAEFDENATAKIALLEEFEPKITPETDLGGARTALRGLQERWEKVGKVPRNRMNELEGRIRALEKKVSTAADAEWRRSDPEVKARANQFWDRAADFEQQAEKADAAGKARDAEKLRAQSAQWREWAEAAENAVDDL